MNIDNMATQENKLLSMMETHQNPLSISGHDGTARGVSDRIEAVRNHQKSDEMAAGCGYGFGNWSDSVSNRIEVTHKHAQKTDEMVGCNPTMLGTWGN